jgi:hypothetical protein
MNMQNNIKEKLIKKILNLPSFHVNFQKSLANMESENILQEFIVDTSDVDVIDADMFEIGTLSGNFLQIADIFPTPIMINIKTVIHNALNNNRPDVIKMLTEKVNLIDYERSIMILCAKMKMFELLAYLIDKHVEIDVDNYECVYYLAYLGKLDLLKLILQEYKFPNIFEIASKISIQAIIHNHLDVLKFFCPVSGFDSAPDQMFVFFANSVRFGGHLDIVKYFIDGGLSIKQQNYQVVEIAKQCERCEILQYFAHIDKEILQLLSIDDKMKYGLQEEIISRHISNAVCGIMQEPINEGDKYVLCEKVLHSYGYDTWKKWILKGAQWRCPLCFSKVNYTIYTNLKPI